MEERQLEDWLTELSELPISPSLNLMERTREKVEKKALKQEKRKARIPFLMIVFLNSLLVIGEMLLKINFSSSIQEIIFWIGTSLLSIQLPIVVYLLGKTYYQEKNLEMGKGRRELV